MRENEKAVYLEVDKTLWKKVGIHAATQGKTIKEVASSALSAYVTNEKEENIGGVKHDRTSRS